MAPGAATNGHAPTRTRTSELLRIATAGSVDDGKSTLIGRLLYDSKQILVAAISATTCSSVEALERTAPVQVMSPTVR